ncbi:MAG: bifunctional precorrin-2 dehydrogenase/sirohydrochlorin ferrochelatase [Gemmatimonadaceae bacterium]|nr:bifunctional precorrin-2 dehydrogenase/sirohydrochlorin ferrochelatase [Gemmatimonadaceae bacterium]
MSGYPVVLDGESIDALVVGGGSVAARKVRALLDAGARVRVVAPAIGEPLRAMARADARCTLVERSYESSDLDGATFVVAATSDRALNAAIAAEARCAPRLVNVADDPDAGNCVTVAVHRAGDLVIGVSAGGVPGAAARIRDAIAARFDDRYAAALRALAALRRRLLAAGDRTAWQRAHDALVGERFCERVEAGVVADEVAAWR